MEPVVTSAPPAPTARSRRRWLLAGLVVLVTLIGGGWGYTAYQWRAAQAALEADRPAEARARLRVCLWVWSRSPTVHLLAARAARQTLDLTAAEAHLDRARALQGRTSGPVQIEYLLLRVQTGDLDEVSPTLFEAVEAGNEQAPFILETLARAYMHHLRYNAAWVCLTRWMELRPREVKAYHWRAWTLERLGNHKGAMADYLKVLELDPDHVQARLRVAEMLLDDKQAPEAIPHLERLIARVPDNPVVQARLGACRLLQGRPDEARPLLEAAAPRLPKDPALAVALANLAVQDGRPAEAEARLRAYLATEPADTEALYVLASAVQAQGKAAEAAEVLKQYEQKTKVVERANELLSKVVDSPTAGPDAYAEAGALLLDIGRDKLGVYYLNRALERVPDYQPAHRALMRHYERKGDAAQALAHRRQLRDPDAPSPGPTP